MFLFAKSGNLIPSVWSPQCLLGRFSIPLGPWSSRGGVKGTGVNPGWKRKGKGMGIYPPHAWQLYIAASFAISCLPQLSLTNHTLQIRKLRFGEIP